MNKITEIANNHSNEYIEEEDKATAYCSFIKGFEFCLSLLENKLEHENAVLFAENDFCIGKDSANGTNERYLFEQKKQSFISGFRKSNEFISSEFLPLPLTNSANKNNTRQVLCKIEDRGVISYSLCQYSYVRDVWFPLYFSQKVISWRYI